jgi:SRSO17 transposase
VLIDRELYLPKEWTAAPERLKEAGILQQSTTIPKLTMAKEMLARAFAHGITAAWVTGDTVYGGDTKLRSWLEERLQPYVLAVPANQRIGLAHRADEVIAAQPSDQWQRLSAGEGSQGPRWYDWVWVELTFRWLSPGWKQWQLCRRSISHPDELADYLVFAKDSVTLQQMVQAAGTRWRIEEDFELGKQQVGLDEYEVRKYQVWYRHQTLAMFALAFLTVLKVQAQKKGGLDLEDAAQLLVLTVLEIRWLLWQLVWHLPLMPIRFHPGLGGEGSIRREPDRGISNAVPPGLCR